MTATTHTTRESWLIAAVEALTPMFTELGHDVPPVRISVGFPKGNGGRSRAIGQCHSGTLAADGVAQVFVSPVLGDVIDVLETVAHELVHAINFAEHGTSDHGTVFSPIAKPLGFLTPMSASPASDELKAKLRDLADQLGEYPHAALTSFQGGKKQGTRQLLVVCAERDPLTDIKEVYKVRMTRQWIDTVGLPSCPCHDEPMEEA
ncbi:hypothetical protein ACFCV3_42060 [Kribbella sp. NPDC056345]|uniref:hypothetical protein n=1 Tax=Kribbella sp. NPDC056345 TaxID=3345789 RepID=UPI0035DAD133